MDGNASGNPARPRRRWFQFTLRGMFVFITLIAVVLGFTVSRIERQRRAVLAIEELGGRVGYRDPNVPPGKVESWLRSHIPQVYFDPVIWVDLSRLGTSDTDLALVTRFESIESLRLGESRVTDAGAIHLLGLSSLERLSLPKCRLSDEGLIRLAELKSLKFINRWGTRVTQQGVDEFKKSRPDCEVFP